MSKNSKIKPEDRGFHDLQLWHYELLLKGSIGWTKEGFNLNSNSANKTGRLILKNSKTAAILILKIQYLPIWKGNEKYYKFPKVGKSNYAFKVFRNLLVPALFRFSSENNS